MRIAEVAPLYLSVPPSNYGGTERVIHWLVEELIELGHEVVLFGTADSLTSASLVPLWDEHLGIGRTKLSQFVHAREAHEVAKLSGEFDIIHSHVEEWLYPLAQDCPTPVLSTCHGPMDRQHMQEIHATFPMVPLISISCSQRKPLRWANWIGTVYHGMPRHLYTPSYEHGKYLAFLGRLSPGKGIMEAIAIAKNSGFPLKIAGNVQEVDREFFESDVKPNLGNDIEYIGEIDTEEKNELLANAYAFLFPVLSTEAFGLVLIEALACGTPVIGFDCFSVPEIIEDGSTGFLRKNVQQATDAVADVQKIDRRHCRRVFENRFSVETMAAEYLRIFEQRAYSDSSLQRMQEQCDEAV